MNKEFVINAADITKLAHVIFSADGAAAGGRATYLRSLLAATQAELAGKPILRVQGRPKRVELETTAAAFDRVSSGFYDAVLAAVPDGLTAAERQSKTSFARSAAATLRRAIRTGWNPLGEAVTAVSKTRLTVWIREHSSPRPLTTAAAERRIMGQVESIAETIERLPKEDAARILAMALTELGQPPAQALTNLSVRRHPPERVAAH
jgi:hypothetical protein